MQSLSAKRFFVFLKKLFKNKSRTPCWDIRWLKLQRGTAYHCVLVAEGPGCKVHLVTAFALALMSPHHHHHHFRKPFPWLMRMNIPLFFLFTCGCLPFQIAVAQSILHAAKLLPLCTLFATLFQVLHNNVLETILYAAVHETA